MSEHVRIAKSELEQLQEMAATIPTLREEIELFKRWQAEQKNVRNRPAFLGGEGDNLNRNDKVEIARHCARVVRSVLRNDVAGYEKAIGEYPEWYTAKDAFSEASDAVGQYLVPAIWSDKIYSNVENFGFARRLANTIPMPARDIKFTTGNGAVTATWPGDNTAPTPVDAASFFTSTTLAAETLVVSTIIQKELDEDSIASLFDFLTLRFTKAIAKAEDLQFLNGTGSPFTGVCSAATTNVQTLGTGETAFTNVSWSDMVDLKLKVNPSIQNDGVYVVSSTVFGVLSKEIDGNDRPIYFNESPRPNKGNTGINQAPWEYNGSPLWVVDNALMPTSAANRVAAVFGDFANYALFGVRRDMAIETYDQAFGGVDLSGKRQTALAITERVAIAYPDETAFAVLKTAAS